MKENPNRKVIQTGGAVPESLDGLVAALANLNQQAVRAYAPVVEDIVQSRSRDTQHIEHTLDGLLGFCGYTPALSLYKQLCRRYWEIDPIATAAHIEAYRNAWDSDETGPADSEVSA